MLESYLRYENIRWFARAGIAQIFIILLLLFSMVSFSLPYTDTVRPLFIIIPIYYWSVYRPSLMPVIFVFMLGLIIDFVSGFPVGIHAIIFVIVQILIKSQRLFLMGQPYLMFWLGFAVISSGVYFFQWLFFTIRYFNLMPIADVLASNIITILLFPITALILTFIQRLLTIASKSY